MKQANWLLVVAVLAAGCAVPADERFLDYDEDGVFLFQQGNYLAARDSFKAALALKADDAALLYNLASCCDRLGDDAQAEKYYRGCLVQAPSHAEARHGLIVLLVRSNRRPEAAKLAQDWIAREPQAASGYAEEGWLYAQAGDLPRAQARLQQALEFEPHDARALVELGRVYEAMQRPDRALALYERVWQRNPKDTEVNNRINFLLTHGVQRPHPD